MHELENPLVSLYIPPNTLAGPFRPIALYPPALVFRFSVYSTLIMSDCVVLFVKEPAGTEPTVVALYVSPTDPVDCDESIVVHLTGVVRSVAEGIVCVLVV